MTKEEAEKAVEEAFQAYDMHEWERERWLEKYPELGERMWDEKHARLKTALIEAVRQAERERAQHDINRAYEEGHADGVDAATRDLQFSSGTHDRAGWMVADHNERWHREEAGE